MEMISLYANVQIQCVNAHKSGINMLPYNLMKKYLIEMQKLKRKIPRKEILNRSIH